MKMNKIGLAALMLALAASFAAPLRAQGDACQADIEKFCKGMEPGDGRVMQCLVEHEAELSAPCKAAGEAMQSGREVVREACKDDLDAFCASVDPGEGRLIKCIREHEAELSAKCKTAMAKEKEKMRVKDPCAADEEKFCKGTKGKAWRACAMKNEKKFSAACRAVIAKRKKKMMEKNPCMADIEKFCKDMEPGEGRIMDCLKEHGPELSEACKAEEGKMMGGRKEGGKEQSGEGRRGKKGGRGGAEGFAPEGGPKGPPPEAATDSD